MFIPSKLHHFAYHNMSVNTIPQSFGLLCWNVYKNNQKDLKLIEFISNIVDRYNIDFLLFQEASFCDNCHFELPCFSYDGAANLEFRDIFYGVLTASRYESYSAKAYLSKSKESLFGSHKSLLLSRYRWDDGSSLLILNIHAINFRETPKYIEELERFVSLLESHKGAIILAGDFNSWNKKRMQKLHQIADNLSLKAVEFQDSSKIKSFMGKNLDFIFYRGLSVVYSKVLECDRLSDHNPMIVSFRKGM